MLYHKDVGFPAGVSFPKGIYPVRYTNHAMQEARGDRYGDVSGLLPYYLDMGKAEVIEAEMSGRLVVKLLVRVQLPGNLDACLALDINARVWAAKTVYVNERTDRHRTLNRSRYARPAVLSA